MTASLSIIITSHNDPEQTALTMASIRETAPSHVEVVIVDDCSATPLHHYIKPNEQTKLIRNHHRCGCGPSRHIGALNAGGEWLLICDSHMRFTPGWFEAWNRYPVGPDSERMVFCATCLGLDSEHMDVNNPVGEYHGATLSLYGPDRNDPKGPMQVFEAVWWLESSDPDDGRELAAIMGACYFVSRDWFLFLSPTRYLRTWGCDEQMISLKSWLAGGSVRLAKSVKIGHKFLIKGKEKQCWGAPHGDFVWNKLFAMNTLLPPDLAVKLSNLLLSGSATGDNEAAKRLYRDNYHIVATERAMNKTLFTRDFDWYCAKFGIPLP